MSSISSRAPSPAPNASSPSPREIVQTYPTSSVVAPGRVPLGAGETLRAAVQLPDGTIKAVVSTDAGGQIALMLKEVEPGGAVAKSPGVLANNIVTGSPITVAITSLNRGPLNHGNSVAVTWAASATGAAGSEIFHATVVDGQVREVKNLSNNAPGNQQLVGVSYNPDTLAVRVTWSTIGKPNSQQSAEIPFVTGTLTPTGTASATRTPTPTESTSSTSTPTRTAGDIYRVVEPGSQTSTSTPTGTPTPSKPTWAQQIWRSLTQTLTPTPTKTPPGDANSWTPLMPPSANPPPFSPNNAGRPAGGISPSPHSSIVGAETSGAWSAAAGPDLAAVMIAVGAMLVVHWQSGTR